MASYFLVMKSYNVGNSEKLIRRKQQEIIDLNGLEDGEWSEETGRLAFKGELRPIFGKKADDDLKNPKL
jgi:hypothetical protein